MKTKLLKRIRKRFSVKRREGGRYDYWDVIDHKEKKSHKVDGWDAVIGKIFSLYFEYFRFAAWYDRRLKREDRIDYFNKR